MTEKEQAEKVKAIVRQATVYVKLLPFVYVSLYVCCLIAYFFVSDKVQTWLDTLFYVSPVFVVFTIILSRIFKFCVWHRIECILPLIPECTVIVDTFYPLTEFYARISVGTICAILFLTVLNGYFTFKCSKP